MRKPVTLIAGQIGSRHFGTAPHLAAAVRLTEKRAPEALYLGVANGDDVAFGAGLCALLEAGGALRVVWPKLAARRGERAAAHAALAAVDFVFIGGGDVEAGMGILRQADLLDDVRAAAERGAVFAGLSAGAIMLGERWVRWPHDDARDDEAETFECLGVAACSLDTHGEGEGWRETRAFVSVRAREIGRKATAYGIPSGAALTVGGSRGIRAHGAAVSVFAALPGRVAELEETLSVEP